MQPGTLKTIPLFERLNAAALRELHERAVVRRFAPGAVLWHAGDETRGLHIVLEGRVRIVGVEDGRPHVIHVEEAGGVLGDVPLFGGGRYPATAIAERRTACLVIGLDGIAAAIRHDPELAFALLARMAARVRLLIGRLGGLAGRSVKARLAAWLLDRSRSAGSTTFRLGCTQAQLAEELGTVREVVVRALRELRTEGVITSARNSGFTLVDVAALASLAGQPPGAGRGEDLSGSRRLHGG